MSRAKLKAYRRFLKRKVRLDRGCGFDVAIEEMNPALQPFTRVMVQWALRGGRRAVFASFGLHKTAAQLEAMRLIGVHRPCLRLIVLPLGVRQEFFLDAEKYFTGEHSIRIKFIQSMEELEGEDVIYLTNYETIREGKLDATQFGASSLDEADVLRSFGSKTFGEMLFGPMQRIPLRFVATATPSPNDHHELIAYAHYLGVMDIGESRTRFFKRNSEKADDLRLHPHKEQEFWLWVASWALVVSKPSDLGFSDEGYLLPELDIHWHEVPSDHSNAGRTKTGQGRLLKEDAIGVVDASREKKENLPARLAKLLELRELDPGAHRIIWHDLEAERHAIEAAIPGVCSVYGNQRATAEGRAKMEASILGFRNGEVQELAAKPVMLGGGCNFQKHCHWEIFLGIGFKFRDFIQAIHRLQRFGQAHTVRVDLIYSEAERAVKEDLIRKWRQHDEMVAHMTQIVRDYGLSGIALATTLTRSMGVKREEASGANWLNVKNDTIEETMSMESDCVDMILTSPPFSTQYEYTPSYNDFGHTDDDKHFFEQMDFLTPELFRVLKPGRIAAVHVKDRVVPGDLIGESYQTVSPFHAYCMLHFLKHGFTFMGMVTIVTDVVQENNNSNYRLSMAQQWKDGSRMGFGLPEYVLVFRKPPTDKSNGYADEPVVSLPEDYPLSRWQIDAHGFWRSNGNRLLAPEDLAKLRWKEIIRLYRRYSKSALYDYSNELAMAEALDRAGKLPRDFMLLQPQSWHPDVWTDVFRARTMNTLAAQKGREKHICPLQFDIVERLIDRYSAPGELVFDPFAGVGTVVERALRRGRRGRGHELNGGYWTDSCKYCREAEAGNATPSLFDVIWEEEQADERIGVAV